MPFFDYRAIDQTGRSVRGTLSAVNDVDLELRLKRMGLDLITLAELSRQYAPTGRERVTRSRPCGAYCRESSASVIRSSPMRFRRSSRSTSLTADSVPLTVRPVWSMER